MKHATPYDASTDTKFSLKGRFTYIGDRMPRLIEPTPLLPLGFAPQLITRPLERTAYTLWLFADSELVTNVITASAGVNRPATHAPHQCGH